MPNFFVRTEQIISNKIYIANEDAIHINVLRYKQGDRIIVLDQNGYEYLCIIESLKKDIVELIVLDKKIADNEPDVKIYLFQSLPKSDKMEFIIQKCVELGVFEIIPVITENTVVKLNDKITKKTERFQKISEAAAKQSERGLVPMVHEPITFFQAIEMLKTMDESYIAYERQHNNRAASIFMQSKGRRIGIFIGPEGGFSQREIDLCIKDDIVPISLGKRILRTETAAFAAIITLLIFREELV